MEPSGQKVAQVVDTLAGEITTFLQDFVRIPSLSGEEGAAQEFVAEKLKALGLTVDVVRAPVDRIKAHPAFCDDGFPLETRLNVIGRWAGRGAAGGTGDSLILNGHVDVVPPGREELWEDSPWSGRVKEGKLYGRGACDMKSGLTAAMFAIAALQRIGYEPAGELLLESVIGEETGGLGTLTTIVEGYRAAAAIIMEPTALALCPVQAGALTFRLRVPGRATHAAMKSEGVNAIEKFSLLYQAINELDRRRQQSYQSPLYAGARDIAPISIGTIRGGEWHSTVPEAVVAEGRFGVLPGESLEAARNALTETLGTVAQRDPWLRNHPPRVEWFEGQYEPGETSVEAPIVRTLAGVHREITGYGPVLHGVSYGSDLRLFTRHAGIPAVLYGPGHVVNAHSANEYVSLVEVMTATKVLACTTVRWCGGRLE